MKYLLIVALLFNVCYGQEDSSLEVGIITKQNITDTVMCLVIVMDIETSKMDTTVLYSVKQLYKWKRQGDNISKPHYYYKEIGYLDDEKMPINKNLAVIKEIECYF